MSGDGGLYEALLAAHVLCAVLGFGAVLVTGAYAQVARPGRGAGAAQAPVAGAAPRVVPEAARRYFRPGPNRVARLMWAVPALGLTLAGLGGWQDLGHAWLWVGAALWVLAASVTTAVVWPAEARLQELVSVAAPGEADVEVVARRAARGSLLVDLAVVAAFVVMIAQPG